MKRKNILFFSPFAALIPHSVPEARFGNYLARMGHIITYVRCRGVFNDYCVAMAGNSIAGNADTEEKQKICARCRKCEPVLTGRCNSFFLLGFDDPVVKAEIENSIPNINTYNFSDYHYKGIAVGRYAAYEALLHFKKRSLIFNENEFREVLRTIRQSIVVIESIQRHYSGGNWPDIVFIYNTYYGVNAAAREILKLHGVEVKSIHAGPNLAKFYDTLLVAREHNLNFYLDLKNNWDVSKLENLNKIEANEIIAHYDELFSAKSVFVYSSATSGRSGDVRGHYKIAESSKLILAAMSSDDERFAAQFVGAIDPPKDAAFQNQTAWILNLVEFAKLNPEVFVLIRVHPREFPNKREKVTAESAKALLKLFEKLPDNAAINWPEDKFSMYEVMINSDVVVTAWSSAAKEAALLGIPVLTYMSAALLYPPELVDVGLNVEEYNRKLLVLTRKGWSLERSGSVLKWLVNEQVRNVVQVGSNLFQNRGFVTKVFEKILRLIDLRLYVYWLICKPFRQNYSNLNKIVFSQNEADSQEFRSIDTPDERDILVEVRSNLIRKIVQTDTGDDRRKGIDKLHQYQ
jgi:hypothetical protein